MKSAGQIPVSVRSNEVEWDSKVQMQRRLSVEDGSDAAVWYLNGGILLEKLLNLPFGAAL